VGVSPGLPAGSGRVPWPTCWRWACPLAYLLAVGVSPGLPAGSGRVPYVGEASVPVPAHPGGVEAVHHLVGCTKRSRHFRSLSLPRTIICFFPTDLHILETVVSTFPLLAGNVASLATYTVALAVLFNPNVISLSKALVLLSFLSPFLPFSLGFPHLPLERKFFVCFLDNNNFCT
jgi:hypothetical protein